MANHLVRRRAWAAMPIEWRAMLGLRRVRKYLAVTAAALLAGSVAGTMLAAPASAAGGGRVLKDDIKLSIDRSGVLHVHEVVAYDFGAGTNAGMSRTLVTRLDYNDDYDRIFQVGTPKAASADGGPTAVSVAKGADAETVTVGKGQQVNGRHKITLDYTVAGAVTPASGGEQVEWYAVSGWTVPVASAAVTVSGPSALRSASCSAGTLNSTVYCTQSSMTHTMTSARFRQVDLGPGQALRVSVGLPAGTTHATPILEEQWSLSRAFDVNAVTVTVLLVLLVLLLGGFGLLYYVHGRDERAVRTKAGAGDHAPIISDGGDGGLQFAPPNGVRPGQVGTLLDEQADVVDVTATIVDLAVRGYLLIEELPHGRSARVDWRLVRKHAPVADLLPYERRLFDALFDGRDAVKLSEIGRGDFSEKLAGVRRAMYDDVVRQGWFAHRPDSVRTRWTLSGLIVAVLGVAATVLLAIYTTYALAGLALIIAGAALAMGGQYMPAKTSKGATVLAHTIGFREYLYRADDVDNIPENRRIELFSRYLPYAVVFDNVEQWDDILAAHNDDPSAHADNLSWYQGPAEWDMSIFGDSFQTFVITTSGAISGTRQLRAMK